MMAWWVLDGIKSVLDRRRQCSNNILQSAAGNALTAFFVRHWHQVQVMSTE
jgi:hypothetical protein